MRCLAEAEQEEQLSPELQEEAAADAAGLKIERQRLWHLFQISATAVAQLYKDSGCQQPGLSMWDPFQNAAMAVTSLYKESGDAYQRSFERGVQPFHEAIALHGLNGAMASISMRSGAPGSPSQDGGIASSGRRKSTFLEDDQNPLGSEDLALRLDSAGIRKRTSAQFGDATTDSPSLKRNRMV
ncbi:hypothetical protein NN561_017518 [Cricetulus griseus]